MIKYKDLSLPLKIAIIGGFLYCGSFTLSVIIGFVKGVTGQW